jgi:hypothetical protein
MTQILQKIFDMPEGAILEPVDRIPGFLFQATRGVEPGTNRPLMVVGNPADFAAVRLSSPVLVYSAADADRMRERSVDFSAVSLQEPVFNRAGDIGYVVWDQGWKGGTLRLIRNGTTWRVEVIESWVS